MGSLILSFPPPRNWQDFEQLTKDIAKFTFDSEFENYGRQGQAQAGVDVFGWDKNGVSIALQCKLKGSAPITQSNIIKTISKKMIEVEVERADNFTPKLNRFIIATTSFRDVEIQSYINNLNSNRKGKKLPKIEIWFWEKFEEEINKHSELAYLYYETILKRFEQYDKEIHILSLLKLSLNRPAFNTIFHSENNCYDFLTAISDTQKLFTTGKFYDRNGNLLASSYAANTLSNKDDRNLISNIEKELQEIRNYTTDNLRNGNIEQRNNFLYFPGDWQTKISETLNNKKKNNY